MASTINDQISAVDNAVLAPFVRRILNREDVEILHWQFQPLTGGWDLSNSLYRYTGAAKGKGETFPWSLILKIIRYSEENDDPSNFRYWKREAQAYQSGALSQLPGGITAPQCFATEEKSDGAFWIWMEDVKDEIGDPWPLEQYGIVARCLGRFNGAYLAGRPFPNGPWVTRNWLRSYLEQAAPTLKRLVNSMDHPLIRRALPSITANFLQKIWDERLEVLDILEHLPQTFCHQDAFRRNLFFRHTPDHQPEVVAIDWDRSGIAAVGEEIGVFMHVSLTAMPLGEAYHLEQIVLDGYLDGLKESGWHGDPDLIRFSYAATIFWRYWIGAFAGEMVPDWLDDRNHAAIEQAFGMTMEQIADAIPPLLPWFEYMYDQASRLKAIIKA
jgi:Phosphotransferase enzyme family